MTGQNFKVAHEGSLLPYLFELFPGQSKTGVKNLLSKSQVLVNGESQTAFDLPLTFRCPGPGDQSGRADSL